MTQRCTPQVKWIVNDEHLRETSKEDAMTIKVEMKLLDSHLCIPVISPAVCSKKTMSPFSYF